MITQMVAFRLPFGLVKRLDQEAARRSDVAGVPGAVKRVDVVKLLLESGLDGLEQTLKKAKK